jgi:hypothetical protein
MNILPPTVNDNMFENYSVKELVPMRIVHSQFRDDIDFVLRTRYKQLKGVVPPLVEKEGMAFIIKHLSHFENLSIKELLPMRAVNKKTKAYIDHILRTRYKRLKGNASQLAEEEAEEKGMTFIIKYLSYFEKNVLDPHKPTYIDLDVPSYIMASTSHLLDHSYNDAIVRWLYAYIDGKTVSIIHDPASHFLSSAAFTPMEINPQYDVARPRQGVLVKKYTVTKILQGRPMCFLLELDGEPKNSYVLIAAGCYEFIAPEPIVGIMDHDEGALCPMGCTTMITKNHIIIGPDYNATEMDVFNIRDFIFSYEKSRLEENIDYDVASEPVQIQLSTVIPDEIRTIGVEKVDDAPVIANIIAQGHHTRLIGDVNHTYGTDEGMVFAVKGGAEPYAVLP